eukprot:TRINITY_DN65827_c0_g1_i1.p1 TRINITY_DN65827_c0_g1~~TRINITY_DN65827_c0_g1_i1.p1  ORF type:complete len:495 (-),score=101.09 TRINITY_DN65827_c0_g1_i1:53-1444(-)
MAASDSAPVFAEVTCPQVAPQPLAPLAEAAAQLLTQRKETITVFDATAGGLIQAALLARPGASKYATCAANTISTRRSAQLLGDSLVADLSATKPTDAASYRASKQSAVLAVAREMRAAVGATWCVAESGACGPTFTFEGIDRGFTAICVSGPVERAVMVESEHADREANMWGFTKAALDLLSSCLEEASSQAAEAAAAATAIEGKEDRFRGVTVEISPGSKVSAAAFGTELRERLSEWAANGKRGLWFKVPIACSRFIAPLTGEGFKFHHAKPEYVMLTRWLEESPSKLPRYSFTQIGVGGCVVNSMNEVLMVQEKVNPEANFQGLWKLPGGLADPGEDLAVTAGREVLEETGIQTELHGVVSFRHSHTARFGQSDIYCVVRLRALTEEIKLCPEEIADAKWMTLEDIKQRVPKEKLPSMENCVSSTTCRVIEEALNGSLIQGTPMPSTAGKTVMLYAASAL